LMVLLYFDWFGSLEELKEWEETQKVILVKNKGIKFRGRYGPLNRKFHFAWVFETESYDKLIEVLMDPKNPPRDYKKLTHGAFEILQGPFP